MKKEDIKLTVAIVYGILFACLFAIPSAIIIRFFDEGILSFIGRALALLIPIGFYLGYITIGKGIKEHLSMLIMFFTIIITIIVHFLADINEVGVISLIYMMFFGFITAKIMSIIIKKKMLTKQEYSTLARKFSQRTVGITLLLMFIFFVLIALAMYFN